MYCTKYIQRFFSLSASSYVFSMGFSDILWKVFPVFVLKIYFGQDVKKISLFWA